MGEWISFQALASSMLLVLATLIALMAFVAATRTVYAGFRLWLLSLGLLALAPMVLLVFPADAPIRDARFFVSWLPMFGATVAAHEGVRRFRRRPSSWRRDVVAAAAGLGLAALARLLDAGYPVLLLICSITAAAILGGATSGCLRGVRPGLRPSYYLLGASYAGLALVLLARALIVALSGDRQSAEVVLFFGGTIATMSAVIGAILAVGQRQEVEMLDALRVLQAQATTDFLTGLPNRRRFFELAQVALEESPGGSSGELCVILFDIDRFKRINDVFGHDLGDLVLRRVAGSLAEVLPEAAPRGRIGGEEFAALLALDRAAAAELARNVLSAVSQHAHRDVLRRPVTLSAGVATVGPGGLDEALRRADRGLYAAKRSGRNRVVEVEDEGAGRERGELAGSEAAGAIARSVVRRRPDGREGEG
ncbi:MAG: GGDEF domain-containing protein [Acidobacteria bacterium]|nr:MAG: GGDEF domain-containing protein [Acidobacteriota bacterium]REK08544.1 MAG: GGDEF domain-containing protein [Acidobacteriota bacterium]